MNTDIKNEDQLLNYRKRTYWVLLLVVVYLGIGQIILRSNLHKEYENGFTMLFTGIPSLEVGSNVLILDFKTLAKSLEVHFSRPISPTVALVISVKDNKEIYPYRIIGRGEDWFAVSVNNIESLSDQPVNVNLTSAINDGNNSNFFIKRVLLDGREVTLSDFYYKYLRQGETNVRLFYPADLFNLSKLFAMYAGTAITRIVVALLVVMFLTQFILLILSIKGEPHEVASFFRHPEHNKPISILDSLAEEYSIPLGFLGTVLSIWVALENATEELSDFYAILQILKIAIFTTVLGLSTKLICTIRRKQVHMLGDDDK